VATFVATVLSFTVSITEISISPIQLVPGVGMALLWRWGLSLWPAIVVGDVLGQWQMHDRPWHLIAVTMTLHVGAAIGAAAIARRVDCRPRDLTTTVRFTGIAFAVSTVTAVATIALLAPLGDASAAGSPAMTAALALLAFTSGFLVAGAMLMSWLGPRAETLGALRQSGAIVAVIAVAIVGTMGFRFGIGFAVPLALLGSLAVAARTGTRWGTTAMGAIALASIWGAREDLGPFGGATPGEQGVNVTLAVTLFAFAGLMAAGYHEAGAARRHSPRVVAVTFAVLMVVTGVTSLAANAVALNVDEPFVLSGLVALGAGLGLGVLRMARAPEHPSSRRGIVLAAIAGGIYVVNLTVYLAAVPRVGSGTATALSMTAPLAVMVLSIVVYRIRPGVGMAGAVAVIVAGAIISAWGSLDDPLGIALALGSAVVFAISLLVTQQALKHADVVDVALVSALSAAAVALLVGIIVEGPGAFVLTPQEIGELALAALGAQLVPLLGRSWALSQISANMVGAEGVLAPVATAVLSFLFIDAVVTGSQVLGLVVITAGALIATLAGSRNRGAAAAGGPD
jgi:drug/metabolite transporter (DMT)-like permease